MVIKDNLTETIKKYLESALVDQPIESRKKQYTLTVKSLTTYMADADNIELQKRHRIKNTTMTDDIRGHVVIKDSKGKVVDSVKDWLILRVPAETNRMAPKSKMRVISFMPTSVVESPMRLLLLWSPRWP